MLFSHAKKDLLFPAVHYYNLMQSGRITLSLLVIHSLPLAPAGLREEGEGKGLHLPWNSAAFTCVPTQSNWVPILHAAFTTIVQHDVPDTKAPQENIFNHMIPSRHFHWYITHSGVPSWSCHCSWSLTKFHSVVSGFWDKGYFDISQ